MQDLINIFYIISFIGHVIVIIAAGVVTFRTVRAELKAAPKPQPVTAPKPRRQAPYQMVRYARSLNEYRVD